MVDHPLGTRRMPSSSLAIARGLNALEMSLRRLFNSGGSMSMIVG
ncbi:hypothetical protein I552_0777 [Mycobacterium xenopi 3993]|nr:hypothetical protein I552_0777 [Mycobacterium xenopi 3993]